MAEVSAIDVRGGIVELTYGCGYGAGEASSDEQGQQLDEGEHDRDEQQHVLAAGGEVAGCGEQAAIKMGRPGLDRKQGAGFGNPATSPVHEGKRRSEGDDAIENIVFRGQGSGGESGMQVLLGV